MTESNLHVENATPKPDIELSEVNESTKPKKYSAEEFYKDLRAVQEEADAPADIDAQENIAPQEENIAESPTPENVPEVSEEEDEEIESKIIPKKRFNKEIEKRRAIEAERDREREARIRAETELAMYNKALEQLKQQQEQPEREPVIDPVDNDAHQFYMRKIQALEERLAKTDKQFEVTNASRQFEVAVNAQQADFTKKNPDFDQAYQHLVNRELENHKMLGFDEQQAQQATFL